MWLLQLYLFRNREELFLWFPVDKRTFCDFNILPEGGGWKLFHTELEPVLDYMRKDFWSVFRCDVIHVKNRVHIRSLKWNSENWDEVHYLRHVLLEPFRWLTIIDLLTKIQEDRGLIHHLVKKLFLAKSVKKIFGEALSHKDMLCLVISTNELLNKLFQKMFHFFIIVPLGCHHWSWLPIRGGICRSGALSIVSQHNPGLWLWCTIFGIGIECTCIRRYPRLVKLLLWWQLLLFWMDFVEFRYVTLLFNAGPLVNRRQNWN